ncbi:hypothetical protein ABK040_008891 [Willaertia magna]
MSCGIIKSYLDSCLNENTEDKTKCKWLENANNLCLQNTTFEKELESIDKSLQEFPRVPVKKICCSCPDIKKIRDDCLISKGDENSECKYLIQSYRLCLRDLGFTKEQLNL